MARLIARPIAKPIANGIASALGGQGGGSPMDLQPPVGFDWRPPIYVYGNGTAGFTTSFNANDWKVAATADVWVSPLGNNTTGTGTQANPYRSISRGLTAINALPDSAANLFIVAAVYDRTVNWQGQACTKDINVIAVGGAAVSSTKYETLTWTLHAPGVYRATRSTVAGTLDATFPDSDGFAQRLLQAANLAACVVTAGTWFNDGTTQYVHLNDGRSPDADVSIIAAVSNVSFNSGNKWYVEGVTFEGGQVNSFSCSDATITAAARIVFNGCRFQFAGTGNGLAIVGVPLTIANNCIAAKNGTDGFNYHVGPTNLIQPKAVEIGCSSPSTGLAGAVNSNSTSAHEDSRMLRVNGSYKNSFGPVVVDINTAQSWNIGCTARDSALTSGVDDSAFRAQDSAQLWLDTCTATGCTFATSVNSTAVIRIRNLTFDGTLNGAVPY